MIGKWEHYLCGFVWVYLSYPLFLALLLSIDLLVGDTKYERLRKKNMFFLNDSWAPPYLSRYLIMLNFIFVEKNINLIRHLLSC